MSSLVNILPQLRSDPQATADAIAEDCQARAAARAKEPPKLNLQHLPILRSELNSLKAHLEHRKNCVAQLTLAVLELRAKVQAANDVKKHLLDGGDYVNVRAQVEQVERKLAHYGPRLKDEEERLAASENLVKHWTRLIDEWHQANDTEYDALNALDRKLDQAVGIR